MSIDVYMYFLPVGRNTLAFDHIYDDSLKQKSSNKKLSSENFSEVIRCVTSKIIQ